MVEVFPRDEHNAELVASAQAKNWVNPTPTGRYNLVTVGGSIAALEVARLGGRAALVEGQLSGGYLRRHALVRAARAAYDATDLERFGLRAAGPPTVDFGAVMRRVRQLGADVSHHDSVHRLKEQGVDVYRGEARFTGRDTMEVAGQTLQFARAVIATGAQPAVPGIAGLAESGYLTSETVFALTELPRRLIVLGGGPVGCELAQVFRRLGSEVFLIQRLGSLLNKEVPAAAQIVLEQFRREGMHVLLSCEAVEVERTGGAKCLAIRQAGQTQKLIVDEILVATGRTSNVEGLALEAAGVKHSPRGIEIDDFFRTSNPHVYAAGDVCTGGPFTQAADAMARACVGNALLMGRARRSRLIVPRTTRTDPEVAQVGLPPREAHEQKIAIDSYRASLDGETADFAVVHTLRGRGQIVGATIVARNADETIGQITLAMTQGLPLSALSGPALKGISEDHRRTRLSRRVAALLRRWLAWRR